MAYHVETELKVVKQIKKIGNADVQRRIFDAIRGLADEPRPAGCTKLSGMTDAFRIRVGDYRVVYTVTDSIRVVIVTRVGHRRDVYEG